MKLDLTLIVFSQADAKFRDRGSSIRRICQQKI